MKKALSLTLVTAMVVTICPQGQLVNISADVYKRQGNEQFWY